MYVLASSQWYKSPPVDRDLVPRRVGLEGVARTARVNISGRPTLRSAARSPRASARCRVRIHRLAVGVRAERLGRQVDIGRAGQGVGDHQRRTGQVVGLDQRIDASFEVAVAAQDGRRHQVPLRTALATGSGKRAAVADARRAAVADRMETELFERASGRPCRDSR